MRKITMLIILVPVLFGATNLKAQERESKDE